jgi:lipopolysaccharide exporter
MRAAQIFSGLSWTVTAAAINLTAQVLFTAVLARSVEPAAFGLIVMAMIAMRFVSFFAQMGAAQTLVQAPQLSKGMPTAALVVALAVSLSLYGLLMLCSPLFASYFQAPDLPAVLLVLGLSLPLSAAGALPMALLRRHGRFQASSTVEVLAYTLGYGLVGISLAINGHGVWALAWATLAQQTLALVMGLLLSAYPLSRAVERADWARTWGNGSRYSFIGFLEFLWANVETLMIGRWLGNAALGLINRAQLLCNLPVEQGVSAGSKVLFPTLSAMQAEPKRLRDGFLVMLMATTLLSAPISAVMSAASADVVRVVLGPAWQDAVVLVHTLALGVPAMFMYVACGITLDSVAALRPKLLLQLSLLPVKVAVLWTLLEHGLGAVAVGMVVCEWLRLALGLLLVQRVLTIPARPLWQALGVGLALAALVYASVLAATWAGQFGQWPAPVRLLADMAAAFLVLSAVLYTCLSRWRSFEPLLSFESLCVRLARMQGFVRRSYPI